MKLSKATIDVLKNLATINLNLYIKEGSTLSTKSPANTIIADIDVEETFDQSFGIYDLSRFLGVLSLYEDPDLVFDGKKVTIKEGRYSTTYYGAEPDILTYPEKKINFPATDIEFDVEAAQIAKAMKAAAALGCNTFTFEGDGSKVYIVVSDPAVESSNKFKLELGETDKTFKAHMKLDNIKFMPLNYKVSMSKKRIVRFQTEDEKTTYYVVLETTSSFD